MKNLFFHILCTVSLFLIFRYFKKFNINSFKAVAVNYFVCVGIGIIFIDPQFVLSSNILSEDWVVPAIFTGSLFVPAFYLMGLTVEKVNVSVATVANKMSLVIPVVFSLIYLHKGLDHFSILNLSGIFLALISIILTSYRHELRSDKANILVSVSLPLSIFILGGLIDTLINYINYTYLHGTMRAIFPLLLFATACISGSIILIIKFIIGKEALLWKDILGGILLGTPNYFSLYFLMRTLSDFNNDGALIFPVVNIGVIAIASLFSVILFKEKLSGMNLAGICLSVLSIILIFW